MISRKDYEGLTKEELATLIKKHRLILRILHSLFAEKCHYKNSSEAKILLDILFSRFDIHSEIIKLDAYTLLNLYAESDMVNSTKNPDILAGAVFKEVLDHHKYKYNVDELADVLNVEPVKIYQEHEKVKWFAQDYYWRDVNGS